LKLERIDVKPDEALFTNKKIKFYQKFKNNKVDKNERTHEHTNLF